jgi:hypothetical protein
LYIPPTLRRRNRILSSNDKFDYRQDYINFLKDPQLRETRTHGAKDRLLLIGGGSEPRETLVLDTVQFLNNSLTSKIEIPSLAVNGPLDIFTAFSDVTVKDCLFKDNYYPYSRPIFVRILVVVLLHIYMKIQLTVDILESSLFLKQIDWWFWY